GPLLGRGSTIVIRRKINRLFFRVPGTPPAPPFWKGSGKAFAANIYAWCPLETTRPGPV
ncbi:unnamed protein product, partial [Amoebophrya sp. A120]